MSKDRVAYFDMVRAVAIIIVVLGHALHYAYGFDYESLSLLPAFERNGVLITYAVERTFVPLFLFLTGALLLPRDYEKEGAITLFWKKNLLSLIVTWEVWIILYAIFDCVVENKVFSIVTLIKRMLFLENLELGHAWYVPVLIGIYLFIPFISMIVKRVSFNVLIIPMVVAYAVFFLLPGISVVSMGWHPVSLATTLDLGFAGGAFGFYIILGYLLVTNKKFQFKVWQDILGFLIATAVLIAVQMYLWNNNVAYFFWYSFPTYPIAAMFLFDFIRNIYGTKSRKWIERISKCSFGMFLIHLPVEIVVSRYVTKNAILLGLMSLVISFVIIDIIYRIPRVGKILVLGK